MKTRYAITSALILAHGAAFACSCIQPGSALDRRLLYEKTVYGTVVEAAAWNFKLRVLADYSRSGPKVQDSIRFKSGRGTSCDVTYRVGTLLVVFGYIDSISGQDTLYATHACSFNVVNPSATELNALARASAIMPRHRVRLNMKGAYPLGIIRGYGLDGRRIISDRKQKP